MENMNLAPDRIGAITIAPRDLSQRVGCPRVFAIISISMKMKMKMNVVTKTKTTKRAPACLGKHSQPKPAKGRIRPESKRRK